MVLQVIILIAVVALVVHTKRENDRFYSKIKKMDDVLNEFAKRHGVEIDE